ncbi:MAG TPA: hypothetical protein DEQ74_00930 [Wolbachia sp.]|jgi:hypothetical protein|uniref:hypothetical protein n=1 Tax=Wolbachia endosymbiont of Pentalonia nigronervosa TaxID=1301914 RepID=UPI000ECBEE5C|nr:hypothetical protein [Wolbachia endosymbiont of Pentalonia nigronervosa]MBD0391314.1 hypothetical protein [Wolbachia endosymbiont of Pentalonia nigronervosa]HCE59388.1 hypothetical protein [Wolbachia sp.]
MHDREWREILSKINHGQYLSYHSTIDTIKEELVKKHPNVYEEWKKEKFNINHLFSLQDEGMHYKYTLLHIFVYYGLEGAIKSLLAGKNAEDIELPV